MSGGLVSKHGPSGARQKGRWGGPAQGYEFYRGPSQDHGAPAGKGPQGSSLLSANQLLQEGLQLVLILDAHKLVHHVPILDGQHSGHSRHLDGGDEEDPIIQR